MLVGTWIHVYKITQRLERIVLVFAEGDDTDACPVDAKDVLRSLAIDDELNLVSGAETTQASQRQKSSAGRKSANVAKIANGIVINRPSSRSDHSVITNSSNESLNSPRSTPVSPRKSRLSDNSRSRANSTRPTALLSSELRVPGRLCLCTNVIH